MPRENLNPSRSPSSTSIRPPRLASMPACARSGDAEARAHGLDPGEGCGRRYQVFSPAIGPAQHRARPGQGRALRYNPTSRSTRSMRWRVDDWKCACLDLPFGGARRGDVRPAHDVER